MAETSSLPETAVPPGMVVVTQDEFFAFIKADPRDIMPRSEPHFSVWQDVRTQSVVGRSTPGYKGTVVGEPHVYMLTEAAYATISKATRSEGGGA